MRTSGDELKRFVDHHLRAEASLIVLYLDDPADPARELFRDASRVVVVCCSDSYWESVCGLRPVSVEERQILNANQGLNIVRERGIEWAIHLDADELLHPGAAIGQTLERASADVVRFGLLEAVPPSEDVISIFSAHVFRRQRSIWRARLAQLLGARSSIRHGRFFRAHQGSKSAVRANLEGVELGIHRPLVRDQILSVAETNDVRVLHFDCIGYLDWNRKWSRRLDGTGTATRMKEGRRKQLEQYQESSEKGEAASRDLYRRTYMIPRYDWLVLTGLGLLETVELDLLAAEKTVQASNRQFGPSGHGGEPNATEFR